MHASRIPTFTLTLVPRSLTIRFATRPESRGGPTVRCSSLT